MQQRLSMNGLMTLFTAVALAAGCGNALCQIGMGGAPRPLLLRGATIHTMEGNVIEGGDLLIVGKRIKAVGKNVTLPPRTKVIDCEGKVIIPCLIDAASVLGLPPKQPRHSAEHSLIDAVDLSDRDKVRAALASGVGYAYLRDAGGSAPVGARGAAVHLTLRPRVSSSSLLVKNTEALHISLGKSSLGPASRVAEVDALKKLLKGARSYEESWDKYKEDLEKYEKELSEWAKKNKGKKPVAASSSDKKPTATPPRIASRPTRRRMPRPPRAETVDEWAETSIRCPVCGGDEDGDHNDHIPGAGIPFRFDEFRPVEELAFEDKKATTPSSPKSATKGPKKPKEPSYKRSTEQLVRALNGKIKVRMEVHDAETILAVLKMLEVYPMEVVLEGCTEGHSVAKALAKADYAVVLSSNPISPLVEKARLTTSSRFNPSRFNLPPGFVRRSRPPTATSTQSFEMLKVEKNAQVLADAGVRVVIGSLGEAEHVTRLLRDRAAHAAGWGLGSDRALKAITINAAHALGVADSLGSLKPGKLASFLVLDGDIFNSSTSVEQVYMSGRRAYRN